TRAAIRGVRVDAAAGLVQFATGSQHGTLGFRVYETDDPKGADGRHLLTAEPVLSPVRSSLLPIVYRVEVERVAKPYLVIEELEPPGSPRWAGPSRVAAKRLAAAFDRIAGRLERTGVAGDARAAAGARGLRRFASLARGRNKPAVSERAAAAARAGA